MKTSLLILVAALFAAGTVRADAYLKATVIGTVQTQALVGISEGRIHTSVLNDKLIFTEFQVSKTDYALVVDVSSGGELLLLPKHSGAGLPTLSVVKAGSNTQTVIDTKAHLAHSVTNTATSVATNLFQDLDGEIVGTIKFVGPLTGNPPITKFNFSFTGHGTDPTDGNAALLKFKVTTAGSFVQGP